VGRRRPWSRPTWRGAGCETAAARSGARRAQAGEAGDHAQFEDLGRVERRQQPGQAHRQPRLARPGAPISSLLCRFDQELLTSRHATRGTTGTPQSRSQPRPPPHVEGRLLRKTASLPEVLPSHDFAGSAEVCRGLREVLAGLALGAQHRVATPVHALTTKNRAACTLPGRLHLDRAPSSNDR
jgi:hypothetical protein